MACFEIGLAIRGGIAGLPCRMRAGLKTAVPAFLALGMNWSGKSR